MMLVPFYFGSLLYKPLVLLWEVLAMKAQELKKIVEQWHYTDMMTMLQQIGLMPQLA
jgi:hypothetical protein